MSGWVGVVFVMILTGCAGQRISEPASPSAPLIPERTGRDYIRELTVGTDPAFRNYNRCVRVAAIDYLQASEGADTVVSAAMTRCREAESVLRTAVSAYNRTAVPDHEVMAIQLRDVRSGATELVIRVRESSRRLRIHRDAWADCLIVASAAASQNETRTAVATAFRECERHENGIRESWSLMIDSDYGNRRVEDSKRRIVPVLARWVEQVKAAGRDRAAKPDLSI